MKIFNKCFFVTIIIFAVVAFSNFSVAQNKTETKKPEPTVQKIAGLNAKFIVALIDDGEGGAWIGTEDEGVFHCNLGNGKITQFTTKNGLGDNNGYALAIDKLGRLWVGHLNTGVSVFNGKDWKNYDVVDGPIGERIFDIKICPKDGDVWMATSAGISRYKIDADDWEHFTREDGLLEDQASALAFKNDGTLIVGTQCHGLAIFNRNVKDDYKHAKDIVVPERFGVGNCSPVPLEPMGKALPSNLINDIIVTKNSTEQTIWIATNAGLVKSNESLTKLEYWRGKDYAAKVRGLYGGAPKDWKEAPKEILSLLLPEDHLTCLAEDEQGVIWIGTWQNGMVIADQKSGKNSYGNPKAMGYPDNFVTKILSLNGGDYLVGFYGGGIVKSINPFKLVDRKPLKTKFNKEKSFSVAQNNFPNLPSPIHKPTSNELRDLFYKVKTTTAGSNKSNIVAINDDWRTQGNYLDNYGRNYAVLCAQAGGGFNFYSGYHGAEVESVGWIGKNHRDKNDSLRNWVHWISSNDQRVLQCLHLGGRKQSEWDDHKEAYPITLDGPHIYGTFKIPAGKYIMSLYFFNKDGHERRNRLRDYLLTVKTMKLPEGLFEKLNKEKNDAENLFMQKTAGDKTRICNFWGGVYKRFYVEVPSNEVVVFRLDSNHSFNTIVSGVFFDSAGEIKSVDPDEPLPVKREPTNWAATLIEPQEPWWWEINLMDQLLCLRDRNPSVFYSRTRKILLTDIRATIILKNNVPTTPAPINAKDKKLIRPDIAKLVRYAQLFQIANRIDFTKTKYESHGWEERTKLGRSKCDDYEWEWKDFNKFTEEGIKNETW